MTDIFIIAVHGEHVWYQMDGEMHKSIVDEDMAGAWSFEDKNCKTQYLSEAIRNQGGWSTLQEYDPAIHK
jgi:hypothetical protein